nr:YfbM family protein [Streptomyces sp. 846.5]
MSMIGEYARLTPAELDRAISDPAWALEFVEQMMDARTDGVDGAESRCLDVDKAWDTLAHLLRRIGFPVDIAHGEAEIPAAEDWGYGPPRYVTPERVLAAADAMSVLSGASLVAGVTADELVRDDHYPRLAEDEVKSWLTFAAHHYQALVLFFRAAAGDGDAVLVWLD